MKLPDCFTATFTVRLLWGAWLDVTVNTALEPSTTLALLRAIVTVNAGGSSLSDTATLADDDDPLL